MRRKHLVTIALVILGIAVLGLLAIPHDSGPKEPEYKGKKLRKWVVLFVNSNNGDQAREAMQALQEMGSNPAPFLLQWMDDQPQPWRQKLRLSRIDGQRIG